MKRLPDVTRVPDLKRMILQGWELQMVKETIWYLQEGEGNGRP